MSSRSEGGSARGASSARLHGLALLAGALVWCPACLRIEDLPKPRVAAVDAAAAHRDAEADRDGSTASDGGQDDASVDAGVPAQASVLCRSEFSVEPEGADPTAA